MDDEKIKSYIVQMFITFVGILGILSTLLSCTGLNSFWTIVVAGGTVFSVLFVDIKSQMNTKHYPKFIILGSVILMLIFAKRIFAGICEIIIVSKGVIEERSGIELKLPDIIANNGDESAVFIAIVFLTALFGAVVALNVVSIRSMLLAVVTILPIMSVFMFCLVIPSTFYIICCLAYVFGVSALRRKSIDYINAIVSIGLTVAVALVTVLLVYPANYKRPEIILKLEDKIMQVSGDVCEELPWLEKVNNIGNIENDGNVGNGGDSEGGTLGKGSYINSGNLGEVSEVSNEKVDVYTMHTVDTGRDQYINQFVGMRYSSGSNFWWKKTDSADGLDLYYIKMALNVETNPNVKDYLDNGTDSYNSMRDAYCYKLLSDGIVEASVSRYELKTPLLYDRFENMTKSDMAEEIYGTDSDKTTVEGFMNYGNFVSEEIGDIYTIIDDSSKKLVESVMGKKSINTTQEKLAYIEEVKKFLRENYTYTRSPGKVPEGMDFATYFLNYSKEGYCTYFATSATLMFRAAGIPARYVEGYMVTAEDIKNGKDIRGENSFGMEQGDTANHKEINMKSVQIDSSMAHAWVEVFMDGFGWVVVETTPPMAAGITVEQWEAGIVDKEQTMESESVTEDSSETNTEKAQTNVAGSSNSYEKNEEQHTYIRLFVVTGITVGIVIVCGALLIVVTKSRNKKRRIEKLFENGTILNIYLYLEKYLAKKGFRRPSYMDYETYGSYLESENDIFKNNHIRLIIEEALMERFSKKENFLELNMEAEEKRLEELRVYARNIRDFFDKKNGA